MNHETLPAQGPVDGRVGRNTTLMQKVRLLREAVQERRACHLAYSEFSLGIANRFPTRDEAEKEVALRSALGCAERAVMDAAELLTPNVPHEGADAALSRTLPLDAVVGQQGKL